MITMTGAVTIVRVLGVEVDLHMIVATSTGRRVSANHYKYLSCK